VDGRGYPLEATVTDASGDLETGIGDEKEKVGIAAGIGTILGAVIGGKKGAVVGAVIGGAGAILATEGEEVLLERGAILRIRLDRELQIQSEDF
jgi:outer membrane lipoprotein SlyB